MTTCGICSSEGRHKHHCSMCAQPVLVKSQDFFVRVFPALSVVCGNCRAIELAWLNLPREDVIA